MRSQRVPQERGTELVEHRLDVQPPLGRIRDAQHWRDAEQPSPLAHDPEREGVVVGERHLVGERAVALLHAAAHLIRGLAGVREHELASGADPVRREAVKALDDDPRLAAARPGEHQARAVAMLDRDALLGVEGGGASGIGRGDSSHRCRFWPGAATGGCRTRRTIPGWSPCSPAVRRCPTSPRRCPGFARRAGSSSSRAPASRPNRASPTSAGHRASGRPAIPSATRSSGISPNGRCASSAGRTVSGHASRTRCPTMPTSP